MTHPMTFTCRTVPFGQRLLLSRASKPGLPVEVGSVVLGSVFGVLIWAHVWKSGGVMTEPMTMLSEW